jgi:hypothetical protein
VARELSDADCANKARGTDMYIELAARSLAGLSPARALTAVTADRQRTRWSF